MLVDFPDAAASWKALSEMPCSPWRRVWYRRAQPRFRCGTSSSVGNSSLAGADQKDPAVNRVQRMSSGKFGLQQEWPNSKQTFVLRYGLSGFVCVLGFQHVVPRVFHVRRNANSIKIKIRVIDTVLFVC